MGQTTTLNDNVGTPRYIFDRTEKGLMGSLRDKGTIEPFTSTLSCIPRDLQVRMSGALVCDRWQVILNSAFFCVGVQEYMNLPPPR